MAYVIVPPASEVAPLIVAESWTDVPIATGPRSDSVVETDGLFGLTTSSRLWHALETGPVLLASPE